jgi:hypothetical protein
MATPKPTIGLVTAPITTPTYGPTGVFSVKSSVHIAAPARDLLAITLSPPTYPRWCNFVPRVKIIEHTTPATSSTLWTEAQIQPGTRTELTVFMGGNGQAQFAQSGAQGSRATFVQCTALDEDLGEGRTGYRVCWKVTGYPTWLLRSERVQEFVVSGADGQETEYIGWETFGGIFAYPTKWIFGSTLAQRFADWGSDLKAFAEAGGRVD